ncbi:MAG TPA: hypothetical protein EYP34_10695 [Chromatiaceae bacterium]|nr:hypothetical protein [Chromatiaceae bacterium]
MALFASPKNNVSNTPVQSGHEELGCPAFASLVEKMDADPERKYHVLDLAAASGNHIEFFSRFRCRYHIGDVLQVFSYLEPPEPDEPAADFNLILPLHMKEKLDLILVWDGLNYLDKALLPGFSEHLLRKCNPGAWLHAFVYTRGDMPVRPVPFDILSSSTMRRPLVEGGVGAPCYPQRVLEGLMPGFRSVQSRLLKNGIQEFLFQVQ